MKKIIFTISLMLGIALPLFAQQNQTITLDLLNPTYPTKFEYIGNGYWDKTYVDTGYTWFESQIFSFSHLIEGEGSAYGGYAWNGFTVCNSGDNTDHSDEGSWFMDYEWGCMAGGGIMTDTEGNVLTDEDGVVLVNNELPYLVGFWHYLMEPEWWWLYLDRELNILDEPTHCFQIHLDDNEEYEAVGVYVNNHPYTYYANLHGFGLARALNQEGDFLKLIFHGIDPDGTESGKTVEYFLAEFKDGTLIQNVNWEWVDLSALGSIGGLYCTMETTDADQYGPLAPTYFCMDKLQVRTKNVKVKDNTLSDITVYPNPTTGKLIINNEQLIINNVDIFDVYGRNLLSHHLIPSSSHHLINMSHLPAGIYFVKITTEKGIVTQKVVKI